MLLYPIVIIIDNENWDKILFSEMMSAYPHYIWHTKFCSTNSLSNGSLLLLFVLFIFSGRDWFIFVLWLLVKLLNRDDVNFELVINDLFFVCDWDDFVEVLLFESDIVDFVDCGDMIELSLNFVSFTSLDWVCFFFVTWKRRDYWLFGFVINGNKRRDVY